MAVRNLVETLVKLVVDEPDEVRVKETKDRGAIVFNVQVSSGDVGRVIGKDGRVISCIRQVVGAAGAKARLRTYVKVPTE
jgi:uncharacterized protein